MGATIVGVDKGKAKPGIARFLGTFHIVNLEAKPTALNNLLPEAFKDIREKVNKKLNRIQTMDASKQCKFQILIATSRHLQYYARTIKPAYVKEFMKDMEHLFCTVALSIIGILAANDQTTQVHLQKPLVHGGFGILPYETLATTMYFSSMTDAAPFLTKRRINATRRAS